MTIGIAAFGPKAGAGIIAGLGAVEKIGRGAIGGFVSLVVLTDDGRLLRASVQVGGSEALFSEELPPEIAQAQCAGLISSGPNRPEPLSQFITAKIGVGIVTDWSGLIGFHPQRVFLPNLSVNIGACLCGVVNYASAQALDFLDLGQKSSFPDWKHQRCPSLVTVFYGRALIG